MNQETGYEKSVSTYTHYTHYTYTQFRITELRTLIFD